MKNSIRTRLTISFLILAIGPLLMVGLLLSWQNYQQGQQQALNLQNAVARRVSAQVTTFLQSIEDQLNIMVAVQEVDLLTEDELHTILAQLLANNKAFESLHLLDATGQEITHISRTGFTRLDEYEQTHTEEEAFKTPLETKATYYSSVWFNEEANEPIMTLGLPIEDVRTGEIIGVLIADVRIKTIWELIANIQVNDGERIYIVDDQSQVVADRNPSVVLRNTTFDIPQNDGFSRGLEENLTLLSYDEIQLGSRTWYIIAEKPIQEALSLTVTSVFITAVLIFFAVAFALLFGFVTVRNIVRPIENLAITTQAIQNGDLSQRVTVTGYDEISRLGQAFNSMTTQLQQTLQGLEKNVAELEQAQTALQRSEEKYRELFENANDIVYTHDLTGQFTSANRKAEVITGFSQAEIKTLNILTLVHPDDISLSKAMTQKKLEDASVTTYELRVIAKNGRIIPLEVSTRLIYNDGQPIGVQGIARDITERKKAEEALRQSEMTNRALLEAIPDLLLRMDSNGRLLDIRGPHEALSATGLAALEHTPLPDLDLTQQSSTFPEIKNILQAFHKLQETHEPQIIEYHHSTGANIRTFEARFLVGQNTELLIIIRDVTERKQAQEAMHERQKLESIGVLAGGIAHDFNNLLTGMLAQTSLAQVKLPSQSSARSHIEKAVKSAERAADLTRQLLAYAGKGQFQIQPLNINDLIEENVGLLMAVLPKQANLELDLASDLGLINADLGQIQQVIMNLVINAAEAIEEEMGQVLVQTINTDLTADNNHNFHSENDLPPGHYVCLKVTDTGKGMTQETISHIFDPFFSTKTSGRGLGLSATLGIIRAHSGGLLVESELGKGTTFTILFPTSSALFIKEPKRPEQHTTNTANTVLVIDDEEPVREAITDILSTIGVTVLTAPDGRVGLDLYEENKDVIGLVLVDLQMPVMDGVETIEALTTMNPEIKIVLSSGYSETEVSGRFSGNAPSAFLQKPYDLNRLIQQVQEML